MLETDTRTAILELLRKGHGIRSIARSLKISRQSVREVKESGSIEVPEIKRVSKAEFHLDLIRDLYERCKKNIVRVCEELESKDIHISYSTLTRFCRLHGMCEEPLPYAGSYTFAPGEEMQHDTSPHLVEVGGRRRKFQCASLVLCFSHMVFAQCYPTFNRFWCKVFLTDALKYFGGAAARCMVDNTSVVIAHGTGKNAVVAPEMKAFADRFDFEFQAHAVGDKNRSARVERPFDFIEKNFYAGRTFEDEADLGRQLIGWCDKVGRRYKRYIHAVPAELFQAERPHLKPLPIYIPEVELIHPQRIVDVEGDVHLHTNRYSVPDGYLERAVQVRETKDRVRIFLGHKLLAEYNRMEDGAGKRCTLPEHRTRERRRRRGHSPPPLPQESVLRAAGTGFSSLVDLLKKRYGGRAARALRRLHRFYLDYPTEALERAVQEALSYGLCDLDRIERMVLRIVDREFFRFPEIKDDRENENE